MLGQGGLGVGMATAPEAILYTEHAALERNLRPRLQKEGGHDKPVCRNTMKPHCKEPNSNSLSCPHKPRVVYTPTPLGLLGHDIITTEQPTSSSLAHGFHADARSRGRKHTANIQRHVCLKIFGLHANTFFLQMGRVN